MEQDRKRDNPIEDYVRAVDFPVMSLESLNQLITLDAKANKEHGTKLFWWVDIAMETVSPAYINKYVAGLGLPNESKYLYVQIIRI